MATASYCQYELSGILLCDDKGAITSAHVAIEWKYWSKSFEYCIMAKGITRCAQKRGLLLHCTGIKKQELFKTLLDPGPLEEVEEDNVNEYQKALKTLDAQFSIKFNKPNKRNLYRNLKHQERDIRDGQSTYNLIAMPGKKNNHFYNYYFLNWENANHFFDKYRCKTLLILFRLWTSVESGKWHGKSTNKYC